MNTRTLTLATLAASLLLGSLLPGCSRPPRGTDSRVDTRERERPAPPEERAPATEDERAYDLESEGEFPPPDEDVVFEEDELPPAPEDVQASPIGRDAAVGETVGERGDAMTPIEPSVRVPVERSVEEGIPAKDPAVGALGFRVQLVASAERTEAERAARDARARLGVPVYVDFESPFYKVRAGDFRDRNQAQLLRERARRNGYDGAWVVNTHIRVESGDSGP